MFADSDAVYCAIGFFAAGGVGSIAAFVILRSVGWTDAISLRRTALTVGGVGLVASLWYLSTPAIADPVWPIRGSWLLPRALSYLGCFASIATIGSALAIPRATALAQLFLAAAAIALWLGGVASYLSIWLLISVFLYVGGIAFVVDFFKGMELDMTSLVLLYASLPILYYLLSCIVVALGWTIVGARRAPATPDRA